MADIFAEADAEQRAVPRPWAVHDTGAGSLVGFLMISDNIPQPMDEDLVGPYYLWKLLIDERFQGRGYGAATLDALVVTWRAARRRCVLHQLRRRSRVSAWVLPALRLHRHRSEDVRRESPRPQPH